MLIPTIGTTGVGHHKGRKVEVLPGSQIYAFAGDIGLGHRFRVLASINQTNPTQQPHAIGYPLLLANSIAKDFESTKANMANVSTLLAFTHNNERQCCVFDGGMQPRLFDQDHYYFALGIGKLSADPFLRFLVDIFCDGPPTVGEAIFLTTWTIQHVIDTSPGGVAGPIRIAVLEKVNGRWQPRDLPESEIQEHQQLMEGATGALAKFVREMQSGRAAEGAPEPPPAPTGAG